jgi:signal transduction histidine kinase/ActR/RegA family two-component response regulator
VSVTKLRGFIRPLSLAVFVAFVVLSVVGSLSVRSIVRDQEARLLEERVVEAGVVLSSLFNTSNITLPLLGATTNPRPESSGVFLITAEAMRQGVGTIGALQVADDAVSVIAVAGEKPNGPTVSGPLADLARRAMAEKRASGIVEAPSGRQLTFAAATGHGIVIYQEIPLTVFAEFNSEDLEFFTELEGAVYAAPDEDESALLIKTAKQLPLSGRVQRHTFKVGGSDWLLVARSKAPLVGSFAAVAPWGLLGAGLIAGLLTALLVETLSRRRYYAMALVEERTAELRQAREVAEAANRSKSEFLSRMSHELRTPLNAVLGFGQLLELDDLDASQKESVEQIVKGGRHLLHLINEVLDISRIETGSLPLSPESVLVGELIDDTVTLMRPLADHREVRILHDKGVPEGVHVQADRQRLKQILLNLVANAVKYNRHGGSVIVSTEIVDGERLRVNVADTGNGIPADLIDRLFVPFDRLGAERTEVEGAGVGLALSRRLAEAMGGAIGVQSTYGEGSVFSVDLPLAEGPVERYDRLNGAGATPAAARPVARKHKIVYIEDNVSNIRLIERVLEQRGDVQLIPAMQARLGIGLAREHRPELILLDLHLPDMDGAEVLRELRADPLTAATPVVVVSADATVGQVDRLLAQGANAYLTKPLDVQEFLSVLERVLPVEAGMLTPSGDRPSHP